MECNGYQLYVPPYLVQKFGWETFRQFTEVNLEVLTVCQFHMTLDELLSGDKDDMVDFIEIDHDGEIFRMFPCVDGEGQKSLCFEWYGPKFSVTHDGGAGAIILRSCSWIGQGVPSISLPLAGILPE